jgi:NADH:ubiquinone oxidoreductase subunit 3 (subunit A)
MLQYAPSHGRGLLSSILAEAQFHESCVRSHRAAWDGTTRRRVPVPSQYAFIGVFLVVALALPVIGLTISWLLRPKKPNPAKNATYECGMETIGDTWVQFKAQYYLYALIFVVFDVEAVFLFPWAVAYNQLGAYALVEMALFIAILLGGLLYAWRKRALEW